MGQRVARDLHTAKPHMIEARLHSPQAGLNIAQTFVIRELRESQCQEVI
jgi:hypothetical protein